MVRSIVGTLIGRYSRQHKKLCEKVSEKNRQSGTLSCEDELYRERYALRDQIAGDLLAKEHTGFKAPAHGLNLAEVYYRPFLDFQERP